MALPLSSRERREFSRVLGIARAESKALPPEISGGDGG
jgi:hypothetical protein